MIFEKIKNLSTWVKVRTNTGNSLNISDNSIIPLLKQGGFSNGTVVVLVMTSLMPCKSIQEPLVSK